MKKAWIENNQIYLTDDMSVTIPTEFVTVPDDVTINDLTIVNGEIVVKSEAEKLQELKQKVLQELKGKTFSLLQPTDWVVVKCSELGLDMSVVYPEIQQRRQAIRQANDALDSRINSATSINELMDIQKDIEALK